MGMGRRVVLTGPGDEKSSSMPAIIRRAIPLSLALMLALCGCAPPARQGDSPLTGRWEAVSTFDGRAVHVGIDFSQPSEGPLSATISVPDERLLGKPLVNVRAEGERVHFELQASERRVIFDGTREGDSLTGDLDNGKLRSSLVFRRASDAPPVPYRQEEVSFRNGEVTLSGTLMIPPTAGPHPAVVLIHGSSTPSRNDFRFYGDLFARQGIAALIYDKRDVGDGPDGVSRVDLRDLAGDALAAVEMLKRRAEINPRQIGLWGHSQGGWVAPIAAAQSKDVAFVVSFSGPGVTYAEVNKYADATRLRAQGFAEADVREALMALERVDEYVRKGGDTQALQAFLDEAWRKPWAAQTTLPHRVPTTEEIHSWLRWRNLDLDPAIYWERVRVPVLALFGELDEAVPAAESARRVEEALRRGGNSDVTIRIFPGAGHTIESAPDFLSRMKDWTLRRVSIVR